MVNVFLSWPFFPQFKRREEGIEQRRTQTCVHSVKGAWNILLVFSFPLPFFG